MAVSEPPRFPLAVLPTPLWRAARLSAALAGPSILVKRDDLTGFALGGNNCDESRASRATGCGSSGGAG